jgi:hypothetical protein
LVMELEREWRDVTAQEKLRKATKRPWPFLIGQFGNGGCGTRPRQRGSEVVFLIRFRRLVQVAGFMLLAGWVVVV